MVNDRGQDSHWGEVIIELLDFNLAPERKCLQTPRRRTLGFTLRVRTCRGAVKDSGSIHG